MNTSGRPEAESQDRGNQLFLASLFFLRYKKLQYIFLGTEGRVSFR